MTPFLSRRREPPVTADVGGGFVATEAPALQKAIRGALGGGLRGDRSVTASLVLEPGAEGRIVVRWRNQYVGFVPESHCPALRRQLAPLERPELVSPGLAYRDGTLWRIWVGEPLPGVAPPQVPEGYDQLAPQPPTIFGFPLRRRTD